MDGEQITSSSYSSSNSNSSSNSSVMAVATPSEDTRKVEPLKINLLQHAQHNCQQVVPKITIKTIVKQVGSDAVVSSDCSSSAEELTRKAAESDSSVDSSSPGSPNEPHIVPKLTIRSASEDGGAAHSSIVPKLTIKMSENLHAPSAGTPGIATLTAAATGATSSTAAASTSSAANSLAPPPLPKLTIKTSVDGVSESMICSLSPASCSSNCSSSGSSCSTNATVTSTANTNASCINVIPKLTIKTSASGACISTSSALNPEADESSGSNSNKIPKLMIKTGQEHAVIITQHSNDVASMQSIPKMTIKTKSLESNDYEDERSNEKIPKLTIKTNENSLDPSIPKLTISVAKLEVNTNSSNSPKPTSSSSSCSSSSTSSTSSVSSSSTTSSSSSLVVRQLATSNAHKTASPERVPKLMISRQADVMTVNNHCKLNSNVRRRSAEDSEKIPKLTIKHLTVATKQQTITSSEESDEAAQEEDKDMLKKSTNIKVVPKLTIKNLCSPKLKMKAVLEGNNDDDDEDEEPVPRTETLPTNGSETKSAEPTTGSFNNNNNNKNDEKNVALAAEQQPDSDDMDIDEALQAHDPKIFNNVTRFTDNCNNSAGGVNSLSAVRREKVIDTVDLTSSPSPGGSPAHFNYLNAETTKATATASAPLLLQRLQRETSVIQTVSNHQLENTSFLLNQLNAPLAPPTKRSALPPLHSKPQQPQQQQHNSANSNKSSKYPHLTERLLANGVHAAAAYGVQMTSTPNAVTSLPSAKPTETVIDSIEILDTPEGSLRSSLDELPAELVAEQQHQPAKEQHQLKNGLFLSQESLNTGTLRCSKDLNPMKIKRNVTEEYTDVS